MLCTKVIITLPWVGNGLIEKQETDSALVELEFHLCSDFVIFFLSLKCHVRKFTEIILSKVLINKSVVLCICYSNMWLNAKCVVKYLNSF